MAIKRILGGKSKNLFDISKAEITQHNVYWTSNADFTQHFYTQIVEPGKTYTVSYEYYNPLAGNDALSLSVQTGSGFYEGTRLYTGLIGNGKYKWVKQYGVFTIPNGVTQVTLSAFYDTMFRNLQIELGSTATEYVPHELTSYKSIMKVSDVCQLIDKSKFTASGTTNGITWVSNGDGSITLNGTCTDGFALNPFNQPISVDQTHFYYVSPYLSINYSGHKDGTEETGHIAYIETSQQPTKFNTVFYIWIAEGKSFLNVTTFINIDDLTKMFGAGNEPKTVAEFKAKFPNDYYPYSPSCFVTSFDERMPCKTKNLFSSSTEVGIPSSTGFDKSEKRLLEDGKWYIGLAGSNYYSRNSVLDYSIMENSVYVKWKSNGYSVAKCIYCEPNTTYSFTKKYSLIQGYSLGINVGFYTEDGTFISFKGETASPRFVFTTPENCKYIAICMSGTKLPEDNFGAGCFSDLQLVKGTTATDYVPYRYV